jgi:outer membrane protein assembly factor BamB
MIKNEPVLFSKEQVEKIELMKSSKYVCATEHQGLCVEVFYGAEPHQLSGSKYFGLYKAGRTGELMITNGAFIEDQTIDAIVAEDGEIIFSRYRHDYRSSTDGTVFIDGGRAYTRSSVVPDERRVTLVVRDGILKVQDD